MAQSVWVVFRKINKESIVFSIVAYVTIVVKKTILMQIHCTFHK